MATAMLMLEISHADFAVQNEELETIAQALQAQFGFTEAETQSLLKEVLAEEQAQTSIYPSLRLLNEHLAPEQKVRIIEDMWKVALADARLDKYEEHRIRKIADLLYVPHSEFIRTKLKIMEL